MIRGIGTDLAAVSRFDEMLKNPRFVDRIYTLREQDRMKHLCPERLREHAAGLFAAKEAVAKALGTGFAGFGFSDIEILPDQAGCPHVTLHGGALEKAKGGRVHVSVSHDGGMALAFAVLEEEDSHAAAD